MRIATPPRPILVLSLTFLAAALSGAAPAAEAAGDGNWPSFRGREARGIAEGHPTPVSWDVESGRQVRWRTPLPGLGHSSPAIWGNRLFVTTAISGKPEDELKVGLYGDIGPVKDDGSHRYLVYCLDKRNGKLLWERTAHEGVPRTKRHPKSSHANPTIATDGKHVVAFFGSEGLYAYDMKGKLLWKQDLGVLESSFYMVPPAQWGFASSPVIHDGRVIVQADVLKGSFLAAFDVKTGKELWRTARDEFPTWGTPTVHEGPTRTQIVVNGYKHIGGYDLKTGKELWRMKGGGDIPVPTPVVWEDLVFITNAHGAKAPIYAVRLDAKGDVSLDKDASSNAGVAWSTERDGAYMQTPLVYDGLLYVCRDNGVLGCYRARTGEELYRERVGAGKSGFSASAVAADGKLYFTSEVGDVVVVQAGPEFKKLATNSLGEIAMASPAISEGVLYFRTRGHVVAIGASGGP